MNVRHDDKVYLPKRVKRAALAILLLLALPLPAKAQAIETKIGRAHV